MQFDVTLSCYTFCLRIRSLRSFKRQLKSYLFPHGGFLSGPRTTVRRHCDCTANLAPIINRHTCLPTYLPTQTELSHSSRLQTVSTSIGFAELDAPPNVKTANDVRNYVRFVLMTVLLSRITAE